MVHSVIRSFIPWSALLVLLVASACGDDRRGPGPGLADGGAPGDGAIGTDAARPPDGCVPRVCDPDDCEAVPDGCGGTLECGACADPSCVRSLGAGVDHTCATNRIGAVQCWGRNDHGQLGDASTTDSSVPVVVEGVVDAVEVAGGTSHTCARTAAGDVLCWGANGSGELAAEGDEDRPTAVRVPLPIDAIDLDVAANHACAVTSDGRTWCWGRNDVGELGAAPTVARIPAAVGPPDAVRVETGQELTCVLDAGGRVHCWGDNERGQLGNGTTTSSTTPVEVAGLDQVAEIGVGAFHACARRSDGSVWCWGYGLAAGAGTDRTMPLELIESGAVSLHVMLATSCARTAAGAMSCWGTNTAGEAGTGDDMLLLRPVEVPALADIVDLAGVLHACGRTAAGELRCWGTGEHGELGPVATGGPVAPAEVPFTCDVGCVPYTCAVLGAECGSAADGCGGTLSCGDCSDPDTCGGGGVANVCGSPCIPRTCADVACGMAGDGCGSSIDCGGCAGPYTCGGAGTDNVCSCTRDFAAETVTIVDRPYMPAIGIDGSGTVHASWAELRFGEYEVLYARRIAGAWTAVETVATGVDIGYPGRMAVDASGEAHVIWSDALRVHYARRDPTGTWSTEVVDDTSRGGRDPAIAVDAAGVAHVVYGDLDTGQLVYAERLAGGGWSVQTLTAGSPVAGWDNAVAVDDAGVVHVAYRIDPGGLRYAEIPPGAVASVTSLPGGGHASQIAVDSTGVVHIVTSTRISGSSATLTHLSGTAAAGFDSTTVDSDPFPGGEIESGLAIDGDDGVHVFYESHVVGSVGYPTRIRYAQCRGGDAFDVQDVTSIAAGPPALAIDSSHRLHVLGQARGTTDTLEYAVGTCR